MNQVKVAATLAVVMAISFVATYWVEAGFKSEMMEPEVPLTKISKSIGGWTGTDVEVDDEIVRVIDAHSIVNRMYESEIGEEISVHVAAFTDPIYRASAPHHPTVCYPAAGWEVMGRRNVDFDTSDGPITVSLIEFQRRSNRVVTAHWYRVGDRTFTTAEGMQAHFATYWGKEFCPCIYKVMLQLDRPSIDSALPLLESFIPELKQAGLGQI